MAIGSYRKVPSMCSISPCPGIPSTCTVTDESGFLSPDMKDLRPGTLVKVELKTTRWLTRVSICYKRILKYTNQRLDGGRPRVRSRSKRPEPSTVAAGSTRSPKCGSSPKTGAKELSRGLRRLHSMVVTESVIGHRRLTQPPATLSSWKSRSEGVGLQPLPVPFCIP